MADIQEVVRRLSIVSTSDGIKETTDQLNDLAKAQDAVSVASESTGKATLSLDKSFASIEQRYNTGIKNQQAYQKIQQQVNLAVAQNPALQDRANVILDAAAEKYGQAGAAARVFGTVSESVTEKIQDFARETGPAGAALAALGPIGLAAAAAVGVFVVALDGAREAANEAAAWAKQIGNAADTIGITATQLQAIDQAATAAGVSADDNAAAFNRFAVSLGQLRDGSGPLYNALQKINPALVNQLSVTKDAATAWNLLAAAYSQADKQQQALLARAAFGRGGAAEGRVLSATAAAGGISGLVGTNAADAISDDTIAQWSKLKIEIDDATESAKRNFTAIFATDVLDSEKRFSDGLLEISRWAREFKFSDDFKNFMSFLSNPLTLTALAALAAAGAVVLGPTIGGVALAVGGAAAGAGAAVGGIGAVGGSHPASATHTAAASAPPNAVISQDFNDVTAGSLGVQARQASDTVSALGSAATAAEHYDATIKRLDVDLNNHTISQQTYNRAVTGAGLDRQIAEQNSLNSALGAAAPIADLVAAKELQLQRLRQQNPSITQADIDNQLKLTAAQALGTYQMQAQIDSLNVQTATIGMTVGEAAAYTAEQNRINKAIQDGQPLGAQELQALHDKAQALGQIAQANALAAANDNISFGRQTALLSPDDVQIAQQLKGLFPDVATALTSAQAAALKFNATVKDLASLGQDVTRGFAVDFETAIRNGSSAFDALKTAGLNALGKIADKLAQMAVDNLWSQAFGGATGAGLLGKLFGGGSSSIAASPTAGLGGLPALYDAGGYTGPGAVDQPAGIVHAGEVVWSQDDVARAGGVGVVEAMRHGHIGYDNGGAVGYAPYPAAANDDGDKHVHVSVGVSVDDDGKLQAYVAGVSQASTASGIKKFAGSRQFKNAANAANREAFSRGGGNFRRGTGLG